jgi:hypothetical protein
MSKMTTGPLSQKDSVNSPPRFKKDIKPVDETSDAILGLKPVTFHYKTDTAAVSQFGLVAEEVEKVNPDLVVKDKEGKVFSVRYDAVNVMLLNEFLKEHRRVEQQGRDLQEQKAVNADLRSTVAQQQKAIQLMAARLDQHDRQFQKVNTRVGLMKGTQRLADSNR